MNWTYLLLKILNQLAVGTPKLISEELTNKNKIWPSTQENVRPSLKVKKHSKKGVPFKYSIHATGPSDLNETYGEVTVGLQS